MPEHPRRKDAVKKRLHERGLEEVHAFDSLEMHAERGAERALHRLQGAHRRNLHAGAGLAGIAGEESGEVLRRRDARGAEHRAAQELPQALVLGVIRHAAQHVDLGPEILLVCGQRQCAHRAPVSPRSTTKGQRNGNS